MKKGRVELTGLLETMRGRSKRMARRSGIRGSRNAGSALELLEPRLFLHGAAGDPLADLFVDTSTLASFASVDEDFDVTHSGHSLTGIGTPASVRIGGSENNFLRLATGTGTDNAIIFDPVAGLPFLIVAEFDFRITPGAEGFGFNLLNSILVPDVPVDVSATEPGLLGSIGVGFDVTQDTNEIDDNHVSLHWNGNTIAEVGVGSVDLDRGGDGFIRSKIILSPLRNAQGGHVSIYVTPLDSSGNPESEPEVIIDNVFIPTYVNYLGLQTGNIPERRVYFAAETNSAEAVVDIDNIHVDFDPVPNVPIEAEFLETSFSSVENGRIPGRNAPTADAIVRLNAPSPTRVAVNYHITSRSATPGQDYQNIASRQLVIPPFQSWGVIKVPLIDDDIVEISETFQLTLDSVEVEAPQAPMPPRFAEVPFGQAAPSVAFDIREDAAFGYNVHVDVDNFTFAPENASSAHVSGEGHLNLYVDGRKLARMYSPDFHIGRLSPGPHVISVEVSTNDHRTYSIGGQPILVSQPLLAGRTGNYAGPGLGLHEVNRSSAPTVSLNLFTDPMGGVNVHADVDNLTISPESASSAHVPGQGHLHIYVDGKRVGRMYGEWFHLDKLSAGRHEILVEISGNDHVIYGIGGRPIEASRNITVGSPFAASAVGNVGSQASATMTIVDDDAPELVGEWSDVSDLGAVAVHMALLPTGNLIYWDRVENTKVYNPKTGAITEVPSPGFNGFCAGHNFLPDGRLFITGGHGVEDAYLNGPGLVDTAIYDPWTNSWEAGPDMGGPRWYPTNTQLANGEVLIMSGTQDLFWTMNDLPQVYNPATGQIRDLPGASDTDWLYPFAHLAPNGDVFVSGPRTESYYISTEGEGSITPVATQNFQPFEPGEEVRDVTREYGTSAQYDSGKVLVAGGMPPIANLLYDLTLQTSFPTGEYYPTRSTEIIDLNQSVPTWKDVEDMAFGRRHGTSTILPNGQVLMTGGGQSPGFNDAHSPVFAAELFDPDTETWTTLSAMDVPRLYHTVGVLLPDARVAVAGGGQPISTGDTISHTELQIFSPPYLFDDAGNPAVQPRINSAPDFVTYGQQFQVSTTDTVGDVTWVRLSATTHAFNHHQGFNRLEFEPNARGIRVTAPANSVEAVPGYYMMFIHDGQGVPSEAKIVQINSPGLDIRETAAGSELIVSESGSTETFAVALQTRPTTNVVVSITGGDSGEMRVSARSLVFTPANWNLAQTVTIKGIDDSIFDGTQTTDITIRIDDAQSDVTYHHVADRILQVATTNDDPMDIRPGDKFVASLDTTNSFWGDSLQNLPDALGHTSRPLAALGGWINLSFSHVSDELGGLLGSQNFDSSGLLEFSMDYFGTATGDGALTVNFDSGAQYRLERIRVSPIPPGVGTPVANRGLLDPLTGLVMFVEAEVLVQHTLASGLGYSNRAPFGVALNLPPLLGDDPLVQQARQAFQLLQPPLQELTDPNDIHTFMRRRERGELNANEVALFTIAQFDVHDDGSLAGFEFHGESIVPTFLTPFLPDGDPPFGFPAPFTFGPNGEFYLQTPDGFWKEPTEDLLEILGPNGMTLPLRLPKAAFLNMRVDLVSNAIVEIDSHVVPPSLPEELHGLSLVESNGSLIAFGGIQADGQVNHDMYRYDAARNAWSLMTSTTGAPPGAGTQHGGFMDFVSVGDAGNRADLETGLGAVSRDFEIGKFEVTYGQYAEFLNAVAKTDPNQLYDPLMMTSPFAAGIRRDGTNGNYTYTTLPGKEDFPVSYVSLFDAYRFANWLHNGRPDGNQNNFTTEDGAYSFTFAGPGTRNPEATVFLPSPNEWYKAAYYKSDGINAGYFLYPTRTDVLPECEAPPGGANSANCFPAVSDQVAVGSYPLAFSSYGTYDQGGNVFEWTEIEAGAQLPQIRGGSWFLDADFSSAPLSIDFDPRDELGSIGFRVARISGTDSEPPQPVDNEFGIELVPVRDAGNKPDVTGFGAVHNDFAIGRFEVTNRQYAEFLNAVAKTDSNQLFNPLMETSKYSRGISRRGSPGNYRYTAQPGRENFPVAYVSIFDTYRFANWLHHGKPAGLQNRSTTEDGAYTFTPAGPGPRNPDARAFLPTEHEWYKAAHYKGGNTDAGYFEFPTSSDTRPSCELPTVASNSANCMPSVFDGAEVGSYPGSPSPYGTLDQAGNLFEWTEFVADQALPPLRGGSWFLDADFHSAFLGLDFDPRDEIGSLGFRIATRLDPLPSEEGTRLTAPAVSYAASFEDHGRIYVAGGMAENGQTRNDLQVFDANLKSWRSLAPMPIPVHSAAYGIIDNKLYVAGGFTTNRELTREIQIYDISTGTWRFGRPLTGQGRAAAASVINDTELHLIGGTSSHDGVADGKVWIYNTRFDIWTENAPLAEPVLYASAGIVDGQIFAVGGRTSLDGASTSIHQYRDLESGFWSKRLDTSRFPVSDAASVVLHDRMFQVGGVVNVGIEATLPGAGQITSSTAIVDPSGPWTVSNDRPLVHSLSLVNSADLTSQLGMNSRAVLLGHGLATALQGEMQITIEGVPVEVFFPIDLNDPKQGALNLDRLFLHIPETVRPTPGKAYMDLSVTIAGNETTTKIPVISENAPKIFVYDFAEIEERTFIENATAYAHDTDGNLNFPAQPARPGGAVIIYVTGIKTSTTSQDLLATIDGIPSPVIALGPDPANQPGVFSVVLGIPPHVTPSNNVPVTISVDGNRSNRGVISVYPESQVPMPSADLVSWLDGRPWALGSISPFPPSGEISRGGIRIIQPSGATLVSESGATDPFSLVLTSPPSTDVVVDLITGDPGEVTLRPSTLIFTRENWDKPQTVTAIGVNDTFYDGLQFTPITASVNDVLSDRRFVGQNATLIVQTANDDPLDIRPGDVFNAPLDTQRSGFGDEFINYPVDILGENPGPGHTQLIGWTELEFTEVTPEVRKAMGDQLAIAGIPLPKYTNLIQFDLDYFGVGTDEQVEFETGALIHQTNNRISRAPQDADNPDPTANQGVLDLNSGAVFYMNVTAFLANDAAQQVDKFNRFTPGLIHIYPPPTLFSLFPRLAQLDPPLDILTHPLSIQSYLNNRGTSVDDVKVFSFAQFQGRPDGTVTNFEFHGETVVPQFALDLFPDGEPPFGFPPPFSGGPNGEVYFLRPSDFWKEPDRALVDHLADNPNDGILLNVDLPNGAFLHPHVDFVSQRLQRTDAGTNRPAPASLPEALGGLSLVESDGILYAFGGRDANGNANSKMYKFDPVPNVWSEVVPTSGQNPQVNHAAAVSAGGKIYAIGGENGLAQNRLNVYDVLRNRWSTLAPLPVALHSSAYATNGRKIYVIGGFRANGSLSSDVHIYDIAANRWTLGQQMAGRIGRAGATAVMIETDVYVMGGTTSFDSGQANDEVWVYDTLDNVWQPAAPLLTPTIYASAGFVDNQISLFGGRTATDGPTTVNHQTLDLQNDEWRNAGADRVPAAEAGYATLHDKVYMVGGYIEQGAELTIPGPGQVVSAVRTKSPRTTWTVSNDKPLIHSLSLFNAGDITTRIGENSRAFVSGFGLNSASGNIRIEIDGVPVEVLFPASMNQPNGGPLVADRIYVHIPETVRPTRGRSYMDLTVTVDGGFSSARIPVIDGNDPSLFVFDYLGEPSDRALLDDAIAYASDAAGNLNFAAQPARPGETVVLYATGLRGSTTTRQVTATIDGLPATVVSVGPDPAGMNGIMTVSVNVPRGVRPGNNVLVSIESEGRPSNRAAIAIYPESEVSLPSDLLSAAEGRQWIFGLFPGVEPAPPGPPSLPSFEFPALLPSANSVDIDYVYVGDSANVGDPLTGLGSVDYDFEIGKYEVTYGQYAEFLNAVARIDTFRLYNPYMETSPFGAGIARRGTPGNFTYTTLPGKENFPVAFVSISDAIRFANWLHNGQPIGPQNELTTEDGAYTFDLFGPSARNRDAKVFLPSQDEWYKSAYFKGGSATAGYFVYPTSSDVLPTCEFPAGGSNSANCFPSVVDQVAVGSYPNATSPYGTLDQGGNVFEWTDFPWKFDANLREPLPSIRGGSWFLDVDFLSSPLGIPFDPRDEMGSIGFRMARIPEQRSAPPIVNPPSPHELLSIEVVPLGDAGNVADVTGFGAVNSEFQIGRFEVTYEEYAAFLNAIAQTDTYGLYNSLMGTGRFATGIVQQGEPGNYSYSTLPGKETFPVAYVSIFDAMRFANWLHNGQPSGQQDASTTEDGAYTFTPRGPGTRNPGAKVFLPNENEWYKAAYYRGGGTNAGYFAYPNSSNIRPICESAPGGPHSANCIPAVFDSANVGSYPAAVSPYGTYDQGGNLFEWTEFVVGSPLPPIRGGSWFLDADFQSASLGLVFDPRDEIASLGFRIATTLDSNPPLGARAAVSGSVYVDVNNDGVISSAELGLANVSVTISGPVTRTVRTDDRGAYEFHGLPPGIYRLSRNGPSAFLDGIETLGTGGQGRADLEGFENLRLSTGSIASGYNFGLRGLRPEFIGNTPLLASTAEPLGLFESLTVAVRPGVPAPIAFRAADDGQILLRVNNNRAASLELYTLDWKSVAVYHGARQSADVRKNQVYVLMVSADVAQTASITLEPPMAEGEFTNVFDPFDVNADGFVTPFDALLVINALNNRRPARDNVTSFTYLDVNSDGVLSPFDALLVVNRLNRKDNPVAARKADSLDKPSLAGALFIPLERQDPASLSGKTEGGESGDSAGTSKQAVTQERRVLQETLFPAKARDEVFAHFEVDEDWLSRNEPFGDEV